MSLGPQRVTRLREYALVSAQIRALPTEFARAFIEELRAFAPRLLAAERAGVPSRAGPRPEKFAASRPGRRPVGGLASLLSTAVDEDALQLRTGLLTPQARSEGFYGFILDAGRGLLRSRSRPRRRQIVGAVMGRFGMTHRETKAYTRAISPISPGRYDIAFGRVRQWARAEAGPILQRVYDRAIRAISWSD